MKKLIAIAVVLTSALVLAATPTWRKNTNVTTTSSTVYLQTGYHLVQCTGRVHYKIVSAADSTAATTDPMLKGITSDGFIDQAIVDATSNHYLALLLDQGPTAKCKATLFSADGTTASFTTLTVSSTLTVTGATTLNGATTVNAAATLGGTVDAGSLNVAGQTTIGGAAFVTGATNLAGGVAVQGASTFGLTDAGSIAITGTLNNTGDNITSGGTKTAACVALNNASPSIATATVNSGAKCVCSNASTQTNPVKCAVSSTTLTITGPNTTTDNVCYLCVQ